MSKMRELWASIPSPVEAFNSGVKTVVDVQNQAEHAVVEAGATIAVEQGVISEDTAQTIVHGEEVLQGVREAAAGLVEGLNKLSATVSNPIEFVAFEKKMAQTMVAAYEDEGGGVDGVFGAANVINPASHAIEAGCNAYAAAERGDYKAVGEEGAKCVVDVAATVGVAVGGAALARGALGAGAADAAVADAAVADAAVADAAVADAAVADAAVADAAVADAASLSSDAAATAEMAESSSVARAPKDMAEPNFNNLSEAEMNAAFENAESGTYMELPGQRPMTKPKPGQEPMPKEGLQRTKIRFNEDKPIAHHDDMEFVGIKDSPGTTVRVRRHSANDNAPDGTYARDNPTTQIDSNKQYMLPDGTWKAIKDMTPAERAAAHME
jgi:hypothetical protein